MIAPTARLAAPTATVPRASAIPRVGVGPTAIGTMSLAFFISIGLNVAAGILASQFAFPEILRRPAIDALTLFSQHQAAIIPAYYLFAISSLAIIPFALGVRRLAVTTPSLLLDLGTTLGVLTGLVQAIGFLRWPFMEPVLVSTYFSPDATAATRDAVLVVHEAFNRFAGVAVGEHLGWLLNGSWLLLMGAYGWRHSSAWLGPKRSVVLMVCGACTVIASAEQFGVQSPVLGAIFYVGYVGYTLLLVPWALIGWRAARRISA